MHHSRRHRRRRPSAAAPRPRRHRLGHRPHRTAASPGARRAKSTSPGQLWSGRVEGARSGQHSCYDRVVFDIGRGPGTLGYSVRYVSAVTGPGSGLPGRRSAGARKIQVTINAPSTLGTEHDQLPRVAHLPPAEARRQLRGLHRLRPRRAGPAADAGLRAQRRRRRPPPRRRRRPPLVIEEQPALTTVARAARPGSGRAALSTVGRGLRSRSRPS